MSKSKMRQAVILIHGVGEQQPLETLRAFVKSISDNIPFRNKPDRMNELFELRRLQMPGEREQGRPQTDFYEYYWAHHMRDTKFRMITDWLKFTLFRNPFKVPKKLLPFYFIGWILLLSILIIPLYIFFKIGTLSVEKILKLIGGGGVFYILINFFFIRFIYGYIGDAARYLYPHPDNIDQRKNIMKEGITLLRSLHKSHKYSRIVVVGHSLGSVIGYDLIRNYWATMKPPRTHIRGKEQTELKQFTKEAQKITIKKNQKKAAAIEPKKIEEFRQTQHRLWRELRTVADLPWIITDFITLGSPLTHASMLMTGKSVTFNQKKEEYEFPTCPPQNSEMEDIYYSLLIDPDTKGDKSTIHMPTHSSPFSCTRWTNLYFPHRWFIKGDFIGGPLNPTFGTGIKDIPVSFKGWKAIFNGWWISHVNYWRYDNNNVLKKNKSHPLAKLRSELMLESLRSKEDWPEPCIIEN